MHIKTITSAPRDDQKPGTSGLRKTTKHFQAPEFLERYVQAIFDATGGAEGKTFAIGGDGRFWSVEATQIIIKIALGNGARKLLVGRDTLLSTPAASNIIRKYKTDGGLILSASHNPGGENGDFGVKFNGANGGPASEGVTDDIYAATCASIDVKIADIDDIDLTTIGEQSIGDSTIVVIDPVIDYLTLMEELFDLDAIKVMIANGRRVKFDAMHAITGPYATALLEDRLGCPKGTVINGIPSPDFGGGHPDPNPTWAKSLYNSVVERSEADIAAASDGDGDRNMIVGANTYVTPSDSLAIIAEHAIHIPAYANGLDGVARSMPTSGAVDRVAEAMNVECFVTPTGWKYFGSLMDAGRITLCGEESFGTGSTHVREKDGLWAFLCWLNIMAATNKTPRQLVDDHWIRFGRTFYTRHDYEAVPVEQANKAVARAEASIGDRAVAAKMSIQNAENFAYTDPIDGCVSTNQGYHFSFVDGSKIIMRLSGTGTVGATIRLYFENHSADQSRFNDDTQQVLATTIANAETLFGVQQSTGRNGPDVIT